MSYHKLILYGTILSISMISLLIIDINIYPFTFTEMATSCPRTRTRTNKYLPTCTLTLYITLLALVCSISSPLHLAYGMSGRIRAIIRICIGIGNSNKEQKPIRASRLQMHQYHPRPWVCVQSAANNSDNKRSRFIPLGLGLGPIYFALDPWIKSKIIAAHGQNTQQVRRPITIIWRHLNNVQGTRILYLLPSHRVLPLPLVPSPLQRDMWERLKRMWTRTKQNMVQKGKIFI